MTRRLPQTLRLCWPALLLCAASAWAQAPDHGALGDEERTNIEIDPTLTLNAAFEATLARAPGADTLAARVAATDAYTRRSQSLLAGAPSVQLRYLSDRPLTDRGVSETEGGVDLPLWRWGQRRAVADEARAHREAAAGDLSLHRWQIASEVREAYWAVREAQQQVQLAQRDVGAFRALEQDVLRRISAGDAAPGERLTVEGQRREREGALHEAEVVLADRSFGWRALTGLDVLPVSVDETPVPETAAYVPLSSAEHDATRAESALAAARAEGAGAPRLLIGARNETQNGTRDVNSLSAQLTIPFGGSAHREAAAAPLQLAAAQARDRVRTMQREAQLAHHEAEHELHAREIARAETRSRLELADAEVALARRAYGLGEIALAERLLTEIRAADARRSHELAVIAHGRAIARFNQINGALP